MKTVRQHIAPCITRDGSSIRELMHPAVHGNRAQSLAEAGIPPGFTTTRHRHPRTKEPSHVIDGTGQMTLGEESFEVRTGDEVCIAPGMPHRILNPGPGALRILCCCAPAYSYDDTELLE